MKSTLAFVFLLLLASNLHAQARRRPVSVDGTVDRGVSSLGSRDLIPVVPRPALDPAPPPPRGNPVPVSQLRIPPKAIKEFERSQKAFRSGDVRTSALSLDTRSAQTHQDLSFTLSLLNRFQEAEHEARKALDLDSQAAASRYVLGRALIGQGHVTSEAIEMLRQSENALPNASLVLAQIYFTRGQTDQVLAELRHYLRTAPDRDNKQKAECWVAQLSQQPLPAGCPADITRPSFH
jgi:tetratricopeptide (TPR) repeat protein